MQTISIRYIVLAIFLLGIHSANAQLGIRGLSLHPGGDLGFTFHPGVALEFSYGKQFSKRATKRMRTSVNFVYKQLSPRMDIFPTYAYVSDGQGQRVVAGTIRYDRFRVAWLAPAYDFAFIHKKNIHVFAGLELPMGVNGYDYYLELDEIKNEGFRGAGGGIVGLRARLGAEYSVNDSISIFLLANKGAILFSDPFGIYGMDDLGIGARYIFGN